MDSGEQIQELLKKPNAVLSKLYALVFPKLSQEKTLGELAEAFFIDTDDPLELLKRNSRLYGALLAFQLMMGYGVAAKFEELSKALTAGEDDSAIDLGPFTESARKCARELNYLWRLTRRRELPRLPRVPLHRPKFVEFAVFICNRHL